MKVESLALLLSFLQKQKPDPTNCSHRRGRCKSFQLPHCLYSALLILIRSHDILVFRKEEFRYGIAKPRRCAQVLAMAALFFAVISDFVEHTCTGDESSFGSAYCFTHCITLLMTPDVMRSDN